jgi:nitroimidazol reductase NimA-like FMN-containing flavoprotein (pyridoxamine 5'-phosphate oxidase superfamily)
MPTVQGPLALLDDPVAQELLHSNIPARLAYVWPDGTPRVVPVWFHWNGAEFVLATPPKAPKLKALKVNPKVALTIDDNTFPHNVLMVRGTATLEEVDGIVPEYELAAHRYFGEAQGRAWVQQVRQMLTRMVRISVRPEWVGVLDFQSRFPSALSS